MTHETISIPYGKDYMSLSMPKENLLGVFLPNVMEPSAEPEDIIREALSKPIETLPLKEIVKGRSKAVILVSDITRPVPTRLLLPLLLDELRSAGLGPSSVRIVVATGLHRGHTEEEKRSLVGGNIFECMVVEDHSPDNCVNCGMTESGVPIEINRTVAEADLVICTGNIDPHYFVGYTGGAKAVMPGVSSKRAITATHSMMMLPGAEVGKVEGNPVRAAIEEVGGRVGIDFILNVVLNEKKKIAGAVAGHHVHAHRVGCSIADYVFKVRVPEAADIVVAGAGGFPKDINLYQAQKALDNAKLLVRKGGTIILVAECAEGFGDKAFESWITGARNPEYAFHASRLSAPSGLFNS
jgi:nickel-dependent lactate racemase